MRRVRRQEKKLCAVKGGGPFDDIVVEDIYASSDEEAIRIAARRAGVDGNRFYYFRSEAKVIWGESGGDRKEQKDPQQLLLF